DDVLVLVRDHRPAAVPAAFADDVHGCGVEGVGGAHDRTDVEVVLPVLDSDMEVVPRCIEVSNDRVVLPISILIDDIAPIALGQQLGIEVLFHRPGAGPRTDPYLWFSAFGHLSSRESSADFASSSSFAFAFASDFFAEAAVGFFSSVDSPSSSESASSVSSAPESDFAEPFEEA